MTDVGRYSGTWNGKQVSFKKEWSEHTFTDDECEKLCSGKEIEIEAISKKTGKPFKCKGILADQEFNGHTYVGFKNTGFINDSSRSGGSNIPDEWYGHKFTSDELALLQTGMPVYASDWISRKGSKFTAKVRYGMTDKNRMGFIFEFDD